ncbi:hypothetical protein [Bacillus kexueae]|uniref:hypothetical protein n=1 Tax=Aeribacillus kexueae TaxID=2078952 RepID=UPI001FAEAD91|nr:hypothetical protein [Bacillus kexueae]
MIGVIFLCMLCAIILAGSYVTIQARKEEIKCESFQKIDDFFIEGPENNHSRN